MIALLLAAQLAVFIAGIVLLGVTYTLYFLAAILLSLALSIVLFDRDESAPGYKLMWLWLFILLPLAGELMYFFWGRPGLFKRKAGLFLAAERRADALHLCGETPLRQLTALDAGLGCQARYLAGCGAPLYGGTYARYFGNGTELFSALLQQLENARRSIWLEFFICDASGSSWRQLAEVLCRKAAAGVDVRLLYDALGSLFTLPPEAVDTLRRCGVRCCGFNPIRFSAHISDYALLNHRDHRKLCIIDGSTGFTGGFNLADEYFGLAQPHGKWKDCALLLQGTAVHSLSCTFLKLWSMAYGGEWPQLPLPPPQPVPDDVLVQPFDGSPLNAGPVCRNAYADLLCRARSYVWITTPYLIPDDRLLESLCLCARSGVEVRIITPGIPDKKAVFLVTRSFYRQLMESGVQIYEFTPGFIHSKLLLCDDKQAIVGTANLDFRSLYLQFENGCSLYGGSVIGDIRRDFEQTLRVCRRITPQELRFSLPVRAVQLLLRFFAPLL